MAEIHDCVYASDAAQSFRSGSQFGILAEGGWSRDVHNGDTHIQQRAAFMVVQAQVPGKKALPRQYSLVLREANEPELARMALWKGE